jgi:hypothetical protein
MIDKNLGELAAAVTTITGGALGTEAAPVVTTSPTVTPTTTPTLAPTVTIPVEQLQAFTQIQARLAQMEADQRARDEAARTELVKTMAAKGQVEEALRTQREQAQRDLEAERTARAASEKRAERYALDGQLTAALASQPLVAGGAEQLTQLWRSQFIVEPQGDTFNVRSQDFQPVGSWIAAQLGRPEYAHFLRAQNPGGGTAGNGTVQSPQSAPANLTPEAQPRNMSEAVLMTMAARTKSQDDPRLTPTLGMGLRPLARA